MAEKNNGKNWEEYQMINNQIQSIQAQRQQNLGEARAYGMATNNLNNTIAQGSGVMMDAISPAQFNAPTQNILGKYGVTKPQTIRNQSTQRVGGNTTIINNNTTNNYSGGDYGGPVQGRALMFKQQQDSSVGKFKIWLDNLFSKQKEETARRDRDYERRERNLQKESGKLGRKLEGLGATIGKALDPRRGGMDFAGQVKQLLKIFGIGILIKNFNKVLNGIDWFLDKLEYFGLRKGDNQSVEMSDSGFSKDLVKSLGGKDGETLGDAIKNLFIADDGILGSIKKYIEEEKRDRAAAIDTVIQQGNSKKPTNIGEALDYLGGLLAAMISGSKGLKNHAVRNTLKTSGVETQGKYAVIEKTAKNGSTVKASSGDLGAVKGESLTNIDVNANGQLSNGRAASIKQSNYLNKQFTGTEPVKPTETMAGLQRLKHSANRSSEGTVVSNDFLVNLATTFGKYDTYKRIAKDPKKWRKYTLVARKKSEEDYYHDGFGVGFMKELAEGKAAHNSFLGGTAVINALDGGSIGGSGAKSAIYSLNLTGGIWSALGGVARGVGSGIGRAFEEDMIYKLIPSDEVKKDDIIIDDGEDLQYLSLDSKDIADLEEEFGISFDVSDTNSIDKLTTVLTSRKENNKSHENQRNIAKNQKRIAEIEAEIAKSKEDKNYHANDPHYIETLLEEKRRLEKENKKEPNTNVTVENDYPEALREAQKLEQQHEANKEANRNRPTRMSAMADNWKGFRFSNLNGFLSNKDDLIKQIDQDFKDNPRLGEFVKKASTYLESTAGRNKESTTNCGSYVANALRAGGATLPSSGNHGYTFKKWCSEHGYATLGHWNSAQDFYKDEKNYTPRAGDIISIGTGSRSESGHVTMYTGKHWASDWLQGTTLGIRKESQGPGLYGDVTLFRPTKSTLLSFSNEKSKVYLPDTSTAKESMVDSEVESTPSQTESSTPSYFAETTTGYAPYTFTTDTKPFSEMSTSVSTTENKDVANMKTLISDNLVSGFNDLQKSMIMAISASTGDITSAVNGCNSSITNLSLQKAVADSKSEYRGKDYDDDENRRRNTA